MPCSKPSLSNRGPEKAAGGLFGLSVEDFGNSLMKSVSPGQLRRNPMELRSDPVSGVEDCGGVFSGLDTAAMTQELASSFAAPCPVLD